MTDNSDKPKKGSWEDYVLTQSKSESALNFSEDELVIIRQLISRLGESGQAHCWSELGPEFHRMFIRGYWERKDVVGDVCESVISTHNFRKRFNIENMFSARFDKHDLYHSAYPSYIAGEDIYGHWVTYETVGQIDTSAMQHFNLDELIQYRTQHIEALMEIKRRTSMRLGKRVCRYIYILDLTGLSYTKHFSSRIRSLLQPLFALSGDRYPESLWTLWCINTPYSFKLVWKAIQPWIDPVVKKKIRILGGAREYIPAMEATGIPVESIPAEIGGKSKVVSMSDIIDTLIEDPENTQTFTSHKAEPELNLTEDILADNVNDIKITDILNATKLQVKRRTTLDFVAPNALIPEEDVILEGWVDKRGFFNRSWKKRYFVLIASGLYYFANKPSEETKEVHRGKIDTVLINDIHVENEVIQIVTPYRTYFIKPTCEDPESETSLQEWVDELEKSLDVARVAIQSGLREEIYIKSGFLFKRGKINKSYKRRFFVLTNHRLYYYNDVNTNIGAVLKGKMQLKKILRVEAKESEGPIEGCLFKLVTPRRTYRIKAPSKTEAEEWVGILNQSLVDLREGIDPGETQRRLIRAQTNATTDTAMSEVSVEEPSDLNPEEVFSATSTVLNFGKSMGIVPESVKVEDVSVKVRSAIEGVNHVFGSLRSSVGRLGSSLSLAGSRRTQEVDVSSVDTSLAEISMDKLD